jgi:predicted transcriptional regulator
MTLRLDGPLADRLNLAALATDQAASDVIREALRAHLRRLETDPFHRARYAELRAALNPKEGP